MGGAYGVFGGRVLVGKIVLIGVCAMVVSGCIGVGGFRGGGGGG